MAIEEEEKAGLPEWIVTFGDMMSLLLTFFIMLVSMSEIKEEQMYQAMVEAMRKRFGHEAASVSMVPGVLTPRNSALEKLATMGRARRLDTMKGGDKVKAPVGDYKNVPRMETGDLTSGGFIIFPEGASELTAQHKQTLQAIGVHIRGMPQKIEIRGHTTSRPLPDGESHWDLAYARCRNVMDYLVKAGIDPKRLRLVAVADNEPKSTEDPLLRRQNPRVEVFMLSELAGKLQGMPASGQPGFSDEGAP